MGTVYPWGKMHSDIYPGYLDTSCGMTSDAMKRREKRVREAGELREEIIKKENELAKLIEPISILKEEIKELYNKIHRLNL